MPNIDEQIEMEVKSFVGKASRVIKPEKIDRQTLLFSSGLLDSLAFLKLVAHLDKIFQKKLPRSLVVNISNLDTIEKIIAVVQRAPTR